jgi:hypothetical protein
MNMAGHSLGSTESIPLVYSDEVIIEYVKKLFLLDARVGDAIAVSAEASSCCVRAAG